jgi:hypothetical protein
MIFLAPTQSGFGILTGPQRKNKGKQSGRIDPNSGSGVNTPFVEYTESAFVPTGFHVIAEFDTAINENGTVLF